MKIVIKNYLTIVSYIFNKTKYTEIFSLFHLLTNLVRVWKIYHMIKMFGISIYFTYATNYYSEKSEKTILQAQQICTLLHYLVHLVNVYQIRIFVITVGITVRVYFRESKKCKSLAQNLTSFIYNDIM